MTEKRSWAKADGQSAAVVECLGIRGDEPQQYIVMIKPHSLAASGSIWLNRSQIGIVIEILQEVQAELLAEEALAEEALAGID